jgi:hypothetical protein
MTTPEHFPDKPELSQEVEPKTAERQLERREKLPSGPEHERGREQEANEARIEAYKEAKAAAEHTADGHESEEPKTFIASAERDRSYRQTLNEVQRQMSAPSRAFSKVIHNKAVEKVSDIAGSTIGRPNAVLAGAICAFVLVLGLYVHARYSGYALSGSETIAAFIIGWLVGLLFDLLRGLFKGKR